MSGGTIYTETLVHSAPEQFVNEAPYQLVIVVVDGHKGHEAHQAHQAKITGRMTPPDRVVIGDRVDFDHDRDGTPYFRRAVA